jgi:diguanylate cyclase (GGDEF)-like protein
MESFCGTIVETQAPLVINDATQDPRFAESPYVTGAPFVRFFAGAPLVTNDGKVLGALSAIDTKPREITPDQLELLGDFAAIVMAELELRMLATRDSLTGVFSRRTFKEAAARATALAIRHHDDLSLLLIDLDRFGAVNQAQGHAAGDRVLKAVADICAGVMRETDFVGRLGGEVFGILTPKTALDGAGEVAERLRAAVEGAAIDVGTGPIKVTVSIGVAALDRATRDIVALLEHAEEALRSAKEAGRNAVAMWQRPAAEVSPARRRVLKGGLIVFNNHNSTLECTVRSLSDDGAGLDVSSTIGVPPSFDLQIKADQFIRPCRVVAHTDKHFEVEFVD